MEANSITVYLFKSRAGNFASVCEGVACIKEILLQEVYVKSGWKTKTKQSKAAV